MGERSIFINALDKERPEERAAYVEEACGKDPDLRKRVDQLLELHRDADGFLETPAVADAFPQHFQPGGSSNGNGDTRGTATLALAGPPHEDAGSRIGAYKLLQKIGEGGMGVVFMAEQERPVRRRVALKIIKPGMDSVQVIARFEAERQALAMMDHPHIARVFDAGTTTTGRPYFVMELVQGVPITRYSDENQLDLRERLELFLPVCQAIQHAHQKGVIHRDIKPSNVMVTLCDGRAAPKVIDFGIAKATEQRLTERTLFTHYGMMVGTPEYMSPEQAEMSSAGVDTRGDVYSLGVLLYELLTGTTPLERERLREAAFAEVLRRIREEEPPRPSTRLGTSGGMLATISTQRKTEPQKLTRLVRGELDWIVMRCLEKDRSRRYETVNGLARDVERYLADEPVSAGPPGAGYKLRKFARRNKALLGTSAAMAAALMMGTALATYGLVSARRDRAAALAAQGAEAQERRAAEEATVLAQGQRALAETSAAAAKQEAVKSAAVNRVLRDILASARPGEPGEFDPTVRETLDKAVKELDGGKLAAHGDVEATVRQTIGSAYISLGQLTAAEKQLEAALGLQKRLLGPSHPDLAATLHAMGALADGRRWWGTAAGHYREALAIRRRAFGEEHELVASSLAQLADSVARDAIVRSVRLDEAEALAAQAAALVKKVNGERSVRAAETLINRAVVLNAKGDKPGAESLYREALAIYREVLSERNVKVAYTKFMIAVMRNTQGDDAGAEPLLREAVAGYRDCYGPEHPRLAAPLQYLRDVLQRRGDPEARAVGMEWLRVEAARLTGEMKALPDDAGLPGGRAPLLARLGRFGEATADWELAIRLNPDNLHARFCAAVGRLHEGDAGAHRAHARAMLERAARSTEASGYEWCAKVCLLSPPPDRADVAAAMRLIDHDLAVRKPEATVGMMGWAELTKALAEYRAGDFGASLAWVGRYRVHAPTINYGDRHYHEGFSLALAAMALHDLGESDGARWCVDESARLMERCPEPGQADLGQGPENWQMWEILLREARGRVGPARAAQPTGGPPAGPQDKARRGERVAARIQMELLKSEVARLTGEMKARPTDVRLVHQRAVLNGRLGRSAESTADRESHLKLNPDEWEAYFAAGVGRLYQGDVEGYRAHARAMVDRFSASLGWAVQERLAKTYALGPSPDGGKALATAARLIDQVLLDRQRDEQNFAWVQTTKALVEYRAGNTQACLDWTIKARANNSTVRVVDRRYPYGAALALAAMAHHRLGHPGEARQALAEANRLMNEAAQPGDTDMGAGQPDWQVWAVLLREAQDMIAGGGSPKSPVPGSESPALQTAAAASAGDPDAERIQAAQWDMLVAEVARLTGELKARPDDVMLVHERAVRNGQAGRFAESTADWERKTQLEPKDWHAYFAAGVGRLHQGDVEGYRAHARTMMEKFSKLGDWASQERIAKTYALAPPPDAGQHLATTMRMIDRVLLANQHHEPSLPWFQMTKALVEYRSGNSQACAEWATRSAKNNPMVTFGDPRYPHGAALALAAMAHYRLGHQDAACLALAESERLMSEAPQPGQRSIGDGQENWQVWAVLLREAQEVIGGGNTPPSPRADPR